MKKENIDKARELFKRIEKIDYQISYINGLNNDDYKVTWTNRYGADQSIYIPAELILPVIKEYREDLIERKSVLEKELEKL